jgi:nucleotide-binding universal stress UspA family protein
MTAAAAASDPRAHAGGRALGTIVAGVDAAEGGRDALVLATLLGRPESARVIAVHAHEPERAAEARAALAAEAQQCPLDVELVTVSGEPPADALHRVAAQERADVIVVGSDRHGPLGRLLAGDVTAAAVHHAPCPVAVAPRGLDPTARALRRIGVGFDGRPPSLAALHLARRLAEAHDADLELLHAAPPSVPWGPGAYASSVASLLCSAEAAARKELDAVVRELGDRATGRTSDQLPHAALAAASGGLDVLVVGSRDLGRVHRLVAGSTTARLLRTSRCPLIVVHPDPLPALG